MEKAKGVEGGRERERKRAGCRKKEENERVGNEGWMGDMFHD